MFRKTNLPLVYHLRLLAGIDDYTILPGSGYLPKQGNGFFVIGSLFAHCKILETTGADRVRNTEGAAENTRQLRLEREI